LIKADKADNLKEKVAQFLHIPADHFTLANMEWLGLFGNQTVPAKINTMLDALCHICKEK
jgi:hypothetical protein